MGRAARAPNRSHKQKSMAKMLVSVSAYGRHLACSSKDQDMIIMYNTNLLAGNMITEPVMINVLLITFPKDKQNKKSEVCQSLPIVCTGLTVFEKPLVCSYKFPNHQDPSCNLLTPIQRGI